MFRTLYSRLAAVLLGLCFGTGLVFLALVGMMVDMHQREVIQRLNWNLGQELVSDGDLLQGKRLDQPPGRDLFAMLMRINPGIEIYLLDPEGNVLSFTGPTTDVGQWKVDLQPIRGFLDGSAALPIRGDDPRDPERRKIFSVAPLNAASGGGYLYVILGGAQYAKAAAQSHRSYILGLTGWMVGASIVFAALSGLLLFAMLTRRLRHLAQVIDAFQRGDLSARVDIERSTRSRGDEIDRLGSAFNQMADRLAAQVQELKETDTLRRELVANVSHDLRTPLASLQGYLETLILKGDSLPRDEQRNYLEIALKQTERLGALVGDLFELAKLDSGERKLAPEAFSVGELVQDVLQQFRLAAEAKNVALEARFAQELPFVFADIALTERVFQNLFQNALRHTPEGGEVRVTLLPGEGVVTVHVSDTGEGIPTDKVGQIFDRFYQVDRSHRDKSGRSGLGLAIAKRILELHGSQIEAHSVPGTGTTFSFQIPLAAGS